ncbi:uncharacterized protein LMH87_007631 [Akanthomyces muscarius]|uniref:Uncharacterized protein n=1 Tax=Akanthomyces muscarius TaxID=2231603 RepID=A0A9W8QMJ1_AKAMU|nr:uncharacterized protein LMH87_007631 [Akanthomyces muscarius]KAJ4161600.1 hypothetical protein LMH87_007631 [Akanthomyces muscarius]
MHARESSGRLRTSYRPHGLTLSVSAPLQLHLLHHLLLTLAKMTVTNCEAPPPYTAKEVKAQKHQLSDAETTKSADSTTKDVPAPPLDSAGYLAPENCFNLKIGTVFNDLNDPHQGGLYQVEKRLFFVNKGRDIQRPEYTFHVPYYTINSNRMLDWLRSSFNIQRTTYDIKQLRLTECCVDVDLEKRLGQDQQLKEFVKNSPKQQAFFVYGIAWGKKVRITSSRRSDHRTRVGNPGLFYEYSKKISLKMPHKASSVFCAEE